jgi:hypothetical protein
VELRLEREEAVDTGSYGRGDLLKIGVNVRIGGTQATKTDGPRYFVAD